jgi:hypothetical protein
MIISVEWGCSFRSTRKFQKIHSHNQSILFCIKSQKASVNKVIINIKSETLLTKFEIQDSLMYDRLWVPCQSRKERCILYRN